MEERLLLDFQLLNSFANALDYLPFIQWMGLKSTLTQVPFRAPKCPQLPFMLPFRALQCLQLPLSVAFNALGRREGRSPLMPLMPLMPWEGGRDGVP